jgi:outer membrane biosynthesis protein TonB
MTIRAAGPIAASLAAVAAAASPAFAQTNRPWVDPPKELAAPAQKPAGADPRPAPVAATPADSDLGKEKPAAAKTEPPKADPVKVEAAKPEPVKVEAPKPVPVREAAQTNQRPRPKKVVSAPAPRPAKVAARPQPSPRVAQRRNGPAQRPDGLVVMRMQTLQFPDGRTMMVLTRPGEDATPWAGARDGSR